MDNNVLHTEQVSANNKTYFFDLKQAKSGGNYLKITQSRLIDEDQRERTSFILFERDLVQFCQGLNKSMMAFKVRTPEDRAAYRAAVQSDYPNAFTPWTEEDEQRLTSMFQEGYEVEDLAIQLQRNAGGVRARIKKLGLLDQSVAAQA